MIECTHVYKKYRNGTNALYDINLTVGQGEFVYIIGPTGSGKSTLIKLLDGEEIPTKGTVGVIGIDVGKLRHSKVPIYRRNIGVVFQDYRLLPSKTVFENIAYALEVINMKKEMIRRRTREVMNLVGLDDKGNSSRSVLRFIEKINREYGTTILMVTHDLTLVNKHRKRTIVLEHGHVVADLAEGGYVQHDQ